MAKRYVVNFDYQGFTTTPTNRLHESDGPTDLSIAAVPDGSYLARSSGTLVGVGETPVAPASITKAAAVAGVSTNLARSDHKHDVDTAAPGATAPGDSATEGTALSLARSDHKHSVAAAAAVSVAPGDSASAGVAVTFARSDHKHSVAAAAPAQGVGGANSEGAAVTFARSDHNHTLRTTTGPTDLAIGAIADGEFLKRVGSTIVSAAASGSAAAKYYAMGLGQTTNLQLIQVVLGCLYFDPTLFTTPTVTFRMVGSFTSTDGASSAKLYLYDMGPGTGAFSPIRRSTVSIPFANVGQVIKVDQALTLSATPGVDLHEIHNVVRVYEARMYLSSADVASIMRASWGGLSVS